MDTLTTTLTCAARGWQPHWGDADASGQLLTGLYALTAMLAWGAFARLGPRPGRERLFWGLTAMAVSLLALNRPLDLQVLITATGRCLSQLQGWYDQRRAFQRGLTAALIGGALVAGLGLAIWLRPVLWRILLPLAGLCLLSVLVALRVVSLHHIDALLRADLLSIRVSRLIEALGLLLVLTGAVAAMRRERHVRRDA